RWFEILHGSVVHELVRRSGNISVHVIAGEQIARDPIPKKTVRPAEDATPFDPWPYGIALAAIAVALGVGELIQPFLGIENVDLVFLTAVVAVAVRYGLWPSLLATVASSLCYNFSSFCPRSIPSRLPIRPTSVPSFSSPSSRSWCRILPRAAEPGLWPRMSVCARWSCSTHSAARSPASARSTMCCGQRRIRRP